MAEACDWLWGRGLDDPPDRAFGGKLELHLGRACRS